MSVSVSAPSRPLVSSPLASSSLAPSRADRQARAPPPHPRVAFPASRPLRPFASIANAFTPAQQPAAHKAAGKPAGAKKGVKLIQPSKNYSGTFVLNLTQAELGRQD
ncbi:hypothetical protein FA95DRAFT_1558511 [Auriscalpium vulgare]|uniref:Uncharacterized protein n=1 Tax=Auriscalpium vulgare TaxID=40419 RepID=A0ACB8RVZ9_9AGAM|nr:hypothetical protein FA95DRAFT_1558511 [Auriscalpium vulgare]